MQNYYYYYFTKSRQQYTWKRFLTLVKHTALPVASKSSHGETLCSGRLQQSVHAIISLFRGSLSVWPGKQSKRSLTGLQAFVWQSTGATVSARAGYNRLFKQAFNIKTTTWKHTWFCSFSHELFQPFNIWNTCSAHLNVIYILLNQKSHRWSFLNSYGQQIKS